MKHIIFTPLGILIILILLVFTIRLFAGEDDWICKDGQWQKHGQPKGPPPAKICQ